MATLVGGAVLAGGLTLIAIDSARYRGNVRASVQADLDQHASELQSALSVRLQHARSLAIVSAADDQFGADLFGPALQDIRAQDDTVFGALVVTPDGVARRFRIPLDGIGLRMLDLESSNLDGERLYDPSDNDPLSGLFGQLLSGETDGIVGPMEAPLGMDLMFAVQPAQSLGADREAPDELVAVIFNLGPVLAEAGIGDDGGDRTHEGTAFALGDVTGFADTGAEDFTPRTGLSFAHDALIDRGEIVDGAAESAVTAPGLTWTLYAAPVGGWPLASPATPLILVPTLGVAGLSFLLVRRRYTERERLERDVERATRRLADAMAHERAVFDNVPDGILDVTAQGVVQDGNPAACELLGLDRTAMIGQRIESLLPGFAIAGGEPTASPVDVLLSDGRLLEVVGTGWSGNGAGTPGVTVAVRDVTEQRRVRDVLGRYTRKLEETATRLDEINRVRADLISKISHEIRTPMTTIRGFAELLAARGDELSAEQRHNAISALHRHGERLWDLISDLLELAESEEARAPQAASVAVTDVALSMAEGLDAEVRISGQGTAVVAVTDLQRALGSLLNNAIKYGAGPIRVHVDTADEAVTVDVIDHGPGVPVEFLDQLFEPFTQSSQGDRRTATGLGLGLPLVRTLMRRNDGDVELVSVAEPTIFRLRLPRAYDAAEVDAPARR